MFCCVCCCACCCCARGVIVLSLLKYGICKKNHTIISSAFNDFKQLNNLIFQSKLYIKYLSKNNLSFIQTQFAVIDTISCLR